MAAAVALARWLNTTNAKWNQPLNPGMAVSKRTATQPRNSDSRLSEEEVRTILAWECTGPSLTRQYRYTKDSLHPFDFHRLPQGFAQANSGSIEGLSIFLLKREAHGSYPQAKPMIVTYGYLKIDVDLAPGRAGMWWFSFRIPNYAGKGKTETFRGKRGYPDRETARKHAVEAVHAELARHYAATGEDPQGLSRAADA